MVGNFEKKDLVASLLGAVIVAAAVSVLQYVPRQFALPIVVAMMVGGGGLAALTLFRRLLSRLADVQEAIDHIHPLLWFHQNLPTRRPFPEMRGYRTEPEFANYLITLFRERKPNLIVETGSGLSTLIMGYLVEAQGHGRVLSLDANAEYAEATRVMLREHGLDKFCTVVHAPLVETKVIGQSVRWHAADALRDLDAVDLVLDDGPPLRLGPRLRFASFPTLVPKLAPNAAFVLHYVAAEERQTVSEWLIKYPDWEAAEVSVQKGAFILTRKPQAPNRFIPDVSRTSRGLCPTPPK